MRLNKKTMLVGLAVVLFVVLLWMFFSFTKQKPHPESTLRLKWLANVGFVGDLYADTYGFFTEEGLKVNVVPGGPEHDSIRELQTGEAQFGIASADQVIKALAKGADVVVIAQIYQKNPVQWIYRSSTINLKGPEDLKGKTIGVTLGDNDENIMRALLRSKGIADSELKLYPVQYSFVPFTSGQVQMFPVYRNTQGVELSRQLANEPVLFFDPDKYDVRFVANSVVTTSKLVKDDPERVKRFLKALLRGWTEALNPANEDLAIKSMLRYAQNAGNQESERALLREQIRVSRDLVIPTDSKPIGTFDIAGWIMTEKIMIDQKLIEHQVGIEGALQTSLFNEVSKKK